MIPFIPFVFIFLLPALIFRIDKLHQSKSRHNVKVGHRQRPRESACSRGEVTQLRRTGMFENVTGLRTDSFTF